MKILTKFEEKVLSGKCPLCDNNLIEEGDGINIMFHRCEKCGFRISMRRLSMYIKHKLKDDET